MHVFHFWRHDTTTNQHYRRCRYCPYRFIPAFRVLVFTCSRIVSPKVKYVHRSLPRDAVIARYMPSSCVCLSVCLSDTLRYCIKTAKHKIMQIMPQVSPGTPAFSCQRSAKFERDHPLWWAVAPNAMVWVKISCLSRIRYNSKTVQDRRIVSIKVDRKSYAHYRMVMF